MVALPTSKMLTTFCMNESPRMNGPAPPLLIAVMHNPVNGSRTLRYSMSRGLIGKRLPPRSTVKEGTMAVQVVKYASYSKKYVAAGWYAPFTASAISVARDSQQAVAVMHPGREVLTFWKVHQGCATVNNHRIPCVIRHFIVGETIRDNGVKGVLPSRIWVLVQIRLFGLY